MREESSVGISEIFKERGWVGELYEYEREILCSIWLLPIVLYHGNVQIEVMATLPILSTSSSGNVLVISVRPFGKMVPYA